MTGEPVGLTSGTRAQLERTYSPEALEEMGLRPSGGSSAPSSSGMGGLVVLFAVGLVLYLFVVAAMGGASALANRSVLKPIFPRLEDSPERFLLSFLTVQALVPGGLVLVASLLRGTPLHGLRRKLILPLAIALVPILAIMTYATAGANVVRLPG